MRRRQCNYLTTLLSKVFSFSDFLGGRGQGQEGTGRDGRTDKHRERQTFLRKYYFRFLHRVLHSLPYVFLHRVLHRFAEHISTQISTQICVTSLYTELYTESKYICTYFFQSSTHSWKTLLMSFFFCLCNSFFEDSAISIPF